MRRIHINAQVTAVITLFESIGHVAIICVHLLITRPLIARLLFFILHFACLPYIFVVNTRENKNRLVDQGWRAVFMDSMRCVNISFSWRKNNNVVPFEPVKYVVNNDIFIISKRKELDSKNQLSKQSTSGCNLNVPTDENPSSSISSGERKYCPRKASISSTNSVGSLDDQRQFIVNRKKLLDDLLMSITDEKVYIRLFLQLTSLERVNSEEQDTNISCMEIEETVIDILKNLLRKGPTESRAPKRQETLQILQTHQDEVGVYKEQLESFVNMEEHFLADE
jgi:hypothetical protein